MAEPLKVRGQCPVCQKSVTKDAPRGRVTWRGNCTATKGCNGTIIARRFRSDDEPSNGDGDSNNSDTTNQPPAPPKGRRRAPRKVPRVGYDKGSKDTDEDGDSDGDGNRGTDGKPTDVQDSSGGTDDSAGSGGESTPEPPRKRRREYPYGNLFNW